MRNKIIFVIYLFLISALALLWRAVVKFFPDKKYGQYISRLMFVGLRSTHDRRWHAANRLLKANLKDLFSGNIISRLNDDNLSYVEWPRKKLNNIVYLIGDSHVEFYGRCSDDEKFREYNPGIIWLGPRSFMGAYYSSMYKEWLEYTTGNISALEWGQEIKSRRFTISLGSIDVRCLFLQFTKYGPKMSAERFAEEAGVIVEALFTEYIARLREKYPDDAFGVFEVLYCTDLPEENVQSAREIKEVLKVRPYPILGSFEERSGWCDMLNDVIRECCLKYGVEFIAVNKHLTCTMDRKVLTQSDSEDRFHTTNQSVIDGIFSGIVNTL